MKITTATTLGEIMQNPQTAAVFDKFKPGSSTNPLTKMGYKYTLEKLFAMKQAKIPPEMSQAMMAEFEALGDVEVSEAALSPGPGSRPSEKNFGPVLRYNLFSAKAGRLFAALCLF